MKKIVVFVLCLFFAANLTAQISEHDYENEDVSSQLFGYEKPNAIFVSYEESPQTVYVGEIFPIKIKAVVTLDSYERIVTHSLNSAEFKVLNINEKWAKQPDDQLYTNTFYLQALKTSSKLPTLLVELVQGNRQVDAAELAGREIDVIKLSGDNRYSGVIAKSLAVKSENTNRFDDKSLIVSLDIEATYSNLGNFRLRVNNASGNINTLSDNIMLQYINYDIIVPNYTKTIEFTYFNTLNHEFQTVSVPLNIKSDDVSTHTDLNPKQNKFQLYKDIFLSVLTILCLIIFLFKRYKIFLILAILIALFLLYTNNPLNKIVIPQDTAIRVLPTEKSSVFYVTESPLEVEQLLIKDGYIKIMLPSERIGWVKQ